MKRRSWGRCALTAVTVTGCLLYGVGSARADVTIKQTANTSGLGGFLDSETKSETYVRGDLKCDVTETKMTNKFMGMFGGGKSIKQTQITDLAKDSLWIIEHMNNSVKATSLAESREMMKSMMSGDDDNMPDDYKSQFDTSKTKMEPPTFNVTKTGKSGKFAGFDCEESRLEMDIKGVNEETGHPFKFRIVMDMMLSPEMPGGEEFNEFSKKYAESMGVGDVSTAFTGDQLIRAMSQYGVDADELAKHASELEGFPMRTVVNMYTEGEDFDMSKMAQNQATSEEQEEQQKKLEEAMSKLGGLFGGGKKDKEEAKKDDTDEKPLVGSDPSAFITVVTEVTDVSTKSIKDKRFTVDYALEEK